MRYLLAGGGTGGHIYPALAIVAALSEADAQAEFLYVGTAEGREAKVVPRESIPFVTVSSGAMVNLSWRRKLASGLQVIRGVFEAIGHMRRFRPHVVIGTGGFVSGPVLLGARLAGIPAVIQEQNAFPGVTNRIASRWARAVFVPYEEARRYFPAKAPLVMAGNPVRAQIGAATRAAGRAAFGFGEQERVLLITAGSGGARDFHRAVAAAVERLTALPDLRVLHVTGERYFDQVRALYGERAGVRVEPYLHNIAEAYAAADAGVFRAGALTLAEVQVRSLPPVLIPSPNVAHNHQEWNARTLERRGAALVVREEAMTPEHLAEAMRTVLYDHERRTAMREALQRLAQPDAGSAIAQAIMRVAQGGSLH